MDKELRDRLAGKAGDNSSPKFPKYLVPLISFNGNTGEFRRTEVIGDKYSKEAEPIDSPLEIVILRKRSAFASKLDADPSLFSSEFGSPLENISLFSNTGGRVQFDMSGTAAEIRAKHPDIKTKSVLYCIYNGEVHKLEVKGASLTHFFEWQQKMKDADKHAFEVTTVVGSVKEKHATSKKTYFAMTFEDKPLASTDGIEEAMDEVAAAIERMDKYQAERNQSAVKTSTETQKKWESMDEPSLTYPVEDINPDDIPF